MEPAVLAGLILLIGIGGLILLGVAIGVAIGVSCTVAAIVVLGADHGVLVASQQIASGTHSFTLLAIPFFVLAGVLMNNGGIFTPTESAAIAVLYCLALGFAYRNLKVSELPKLLLDATRTTAIVMPLVGVSSVLSWLMSYAGIPDAISNGLLGITEDPAVVLVLRMITLLLVGTFMDPTPAVLIFTPIFLPIVEEFGIDPVHFGTMIVFNLSLGTITPPPWATCCSSAPGWVNSISNRSPAAALPRRVLLLREPLRDPGGVGDGGADDHGRRSG